jgi:hypothetical protein
MPPTYDGPVVLAGASEAGGDWDIAGQPPNTTFSSPAATRATWGEPPPAQRPRTIALVAWRPLVKGAMRGFATVALPIGVEIGECPILVSNGKAWASLPSKPILDRDGKQKIGPEGKLAFAATLKWRSRELSDRFSQVVVAAVRAVHPGTLDEAEP